MPHYYSKLESVIRYRHNLELEAQRVLSDQKYRLEKQENLVKTLVMNTTTLSDELERKTHHGIGSDEMTHYHQYIRQQHLKIMEAQQHQEALNYEYEILREKLMEASRERKIVENIYENRRAAFFQELHRKEQSQLDELSSRRSTISQ